MSHISPTIICAKTATDDVRLAIDMNKISLDANLEALRTTVTTADVCVVDKKKNSAGQQQTHQGKKNEKGKAMANNLWRAQTFGIVTLKPPAQMSLSKETNFESWNKGKF